MKVIGCNTSIPFGLSKRLPNLYFFRFPLPIIYWCKWYNIITDMFAFSWIRIDVLIKYSQSNFSMRSGIKPISKHEED